MTYLDHNATSPPTGEHLKNLIDILATTRPANPSSPHALGRNASVLLSQARKKLSSVLNVDVGEIIFTSGGTEANNLGTRGVIEALGELNEPVSIITTTFEHSSILKPLEHLKQKFKGLIELIYIKPNPDGYVSLDDIIAGIKPNTVLITIMAANNEIGTIQPVKEFADFLNFMRWEYQPLQQHKIPEYNAKYQKYSAMLNTHVTQKTLQNLHFHVDAVQMLGKVPAKEWMSLGYDSASFSGHKIGALQGIGALFLRRGRTFTPLSLGGAQEKNRRAGTENLPGIVSFGLMCEEILTDQYWKKINTVNELASYLFHQLSEKNTLTLNSKRDQALPNTVHFSLTDSSQSAENLIVKLDMNNVYVSSGSACSSGVNLASHVMLALGKSKHLAQNSIRVSLGVDTTHDDIQNFLSLI